MRIFIACLLLIIGCHKGEQIGASSGGEATASKPTAAVTAPAGSAAAGSAIAAAPRSDLAKAVDDFAHQLALIWGLPEKQRFVALCPVANDLASRFEALKGMPNTAPEWPKALDDLHMALWDARKVCSEQPKPPQHLSPEQQGIIDDNNAEYVKSVHDGLAAAAKVVPGAAAVE